MELFLQILQAIKEIIVTLAAAGTVIMAYIGVNTWKGQLKGKTEYELAIRLLRVVLKTRDAISKVRNPFIHISEMYKALEDEEYSKDEIEEKIGKSKADQHVYNARMKYVHSALSELEIEKLEAETMWGKEVKAVLNPLYACAKELNIALLHRFNKEIYSHLTPEKMEEIENIIYEVKSDVNDKDTFEGRIQDAVIDVKEFVRPYLDLNNLTKQRKQ